MPSCCVCFKSYFSVNGLYHHMDIHHPSKLKGVLKCLEEGCLRLTANWKQLRRHYLRDHKFPVHANFTRAHLNNKNSSLINVEVPSTSTNFKHFERNVLSPSEDGGTSTSKETELESVVLASATKIVCKTYANPSLPRNQVQCVVDDTRNLLRDVSSVLAPSLIEICNSTDSCEVKGEKIYSLLGAMVHPFENTLSTEYRRIKYLRECGEFFEADNYVVGDRCDELYRTGRMILERVSVAGKYIPIEKSLSKFLSLPGVLDQIKSHHAYLEEEYKNGVISNFIQGKLWKQKLQNYSGKFVIPLFLYFDDFEVNNPLGSHAGIHKLGALYYSLPSLPPEYQSSIENVFLTLLFHASDRSVPPDGNYYVFRKFIEDLNTLQIEGITLNLEDRSEKVYFCVGLLLADNLGFHNAMGFTGGFNSNYYCRFCKVCKENYAATV